MATDAVKADVEQFWSIPSDRVHVVPLAPVSFPATERPASRETDPLVLYPAAFWPHKDHITLINAIGEVPRARRAGATGPAGRSHWGVRRDSSGGRESRVVAEETTPGYVTAAEGGGYLSAPGSSLSHPFRGRESSQSGRASFSPSPR